MKDTLERIAKRHLNINTFNTRRSNSLDFHDCAVWGIKNALEEAYKAGFNSSCEKEDEDGLASWLATTGYKSL